MPAPSQRPFARTILHARTAMVNHGLPLGGTCVNVGCVPSKALLWASEVMHLARYHGVAGLNIDVSRFDLAAIVRDELALVSAFSAARDPSLPAVISCRFGRFLTSSSAEAWQRRLGRIGLPSSIFWLMVGQGRTLAAAGGVIGLAAAYATGRLASSWLFEVRTTDPLILVASLALVLASALVATVIPARRAARVDPVVALRLE